MSTSNLFPKTTHEIFLAVTNDQYNNLKKRLKKKKLPPPPFTLKDLRWKLIIALGGREGGAITCRYCRGKFGLNEIAADHAVPLSRAGGLELDNIDFICRRDNDCKGGLTPEEYNDLLTYLWTRPLVQKEVLGRLQKMVKLAAGQAYNLARFSKSKNGEPKSTAAQLELEEPF